MVSEISVEEYGRRLQSQTWSIVEASLGGGTVGAAFMVDQHHRFEAWQADFNSRYRVDEWFEEAAKIDSHFTASYERISSQMSNVPSYPLETVVSLAVIGGIAVLDGLVRLRTGRGIIERVYSVGAHTMDRVRDTYNLFN